MGIAGGAVALYTLVLVLAWSLQRGMLFPAPEGAAPVPFLTGASVLRIPAPTGPVSLLYVPARPGLPTVVHFHGNAEQLADQVGVARLYVAAGLGFLAAEYPGYGSDRSTPSSEASLLAAAEAALRYLRDGLHVPEDLTVIEGRSLGTGVAVQMASRGFGRRLLLVSPYTSIPDVAARWLPWLPARWLVRDRFDSAALAPHVRLPVLVIHGTLDRVIPFELGKRLSTLFPNATFLAVEGAGHNDVLERAEMGARMVRFALAPN